MVPSVSFFAASASFDDERPPAHRSPAPMMRIESAITLRTTSDMSRDSFLLEEFGLESTGNCGRRQPPVACRLRAKSRRSLVHSRNVDSHHTKRKFRARTLRIEFHRAKTD